jgi:hypothetical protein
MKKQKTGLALAMLLSVFLFAFSGSAKKTENNPVKEPERIFAGWFETTSSCGNTVRVDVSYNPSTLKVVGNSVYDPITFAQYPVTGYDSNARMTLVSGVLVATGYRVNFTYGGGSCYVVYSGNLNMY